MLALIVAAGRSSRLYPLTRNLPKTLLRVGPERILDRSIRILKKCGVTQVFIVTGFKSEKIESTVKNKAICLLNPFYESCNNLGSLWMARHELKGKPFIYLHSDIIYDSKILEKMVKSNASFGSLMTRFGTVDEEAMKVSEKNGILVHSSKALPIKKSVGEWIGIAKFSAKGSKAVFDQAEQDLKEGNLNAYDTLSFTRLAEMGKKMSLVSTENYYCIEIDTPQDLASARQAMKIKSFE